MKVLIAIPCYNCAIQIQRVLIELDKMVPLLKDSIKAIHIIDNHSTDQTLLMSKHTIQNLKNQNLFKLFQNVQNAGLGGSHKNALEMAHNGNFSHLLFFHGDNQATVSDIPLIIQYSLLNNNCTVLGSRFLDSNKLNNYSTLRTIGNKVLNKIFSILTGTEVHDLGSGLNIFEVTHFQHNDFKKFSNDFVFNIDLLLYIIHKRIPFAFFPINWSTTDQKSNANALLVGIKSIMRLMRWLLKIHPSSAQPPKSCHIS